MPRRPRAQSRQRRAEAFGLAADDYDRYRPRYPGALIARLIGDSPVRVLDVGAGTGIASAQMREAGADVLAVEPDPRMAQVAADKGIPVEVVTFEEWQPSGRSFDLVVFAQSFHWLPPLTALDRTASILRPYGRLVLLSNRVRPVTPTRQELDAAYAGVLDESARPAMDAAHDDELMVTIQRRGWTVERSHVIERLRYTTDAWVHMVCTYSNVLTLAPQARAGLRARLQHCVGTAGVLAENTATAVICTRTSTR